jgi:hypothetical protein
LRALEEHGDRTFSAMQQDLAAARAQVRAAGVGLSPFAATQANAPMQLAAAQAAASQSREAGPAAAGSPESHADRDAQLLERARTEGEVASARAAAALLPQARAEAAHLRGLLASERTAHETAMREAAGRAEGLRAELETLRQRQVREGGRVAVQACHGWETPLPPPPSPGAGGDGAGVRVSCRH